jgi:hypothetical protein
MIILFLLQINLVAQEIKPYTKTEIINSFGKPDTLIDWGPTEAYYYGNDTLFEIYKETDSIIEAVYNLPIHAWKLQHSATYTGAYLRGDKLDINIETKPKYTYKAGEPIWLELKIQNNSDTTYKCITSDWYYYQQKEDHAYQTRVFVYKEGIGLICKHAFEWGLRDTMNVLNDSDYTVIQPNKSHTLSLNITNIAYDCMFAYKEGLKPGVYTCYFEHGRFRSNRTILIIE